ncbi:MAG: thioesterase family protein [Chloroflexota bacterium]
MVANANTGPLVELPITVKTYDVDFAGIVHNMVYIRWLEDMRFQFLADFLPMEEMLDGGISPILTKTTIEYKWPVRMGDQPLGRMWISEVGRTRWTVRGQILLGDVVAADATQVGYFASLETLRPIRIPEPLRQQWEAARPVSAD